MNRKMFVVAAVLALAGAQALAQSGAGSSSAGSGSSGGTSGGSATSGAAGPGGAAPSGSSRETADEAAAQQKAASARPTEGAGGKDPHPVANGPAGDRQYSNAAPPAREQGRANAGTTATAQTGQPQAQTNAAPSEVSGRVALVNPTDHELAIDSGSATTQVKVAPDAKITVDGKSGSFKDIKQGASVRASLDRTGDGSAKTIDVTSGGKKK